MATSSGGRSGRHSSQQTEAEDYLSRIKLREIFQVCVIGLHYIFVCEVCTCMNFIHCACRVQGMLTHVVVHQPQDPIAYFHEELSRIKKEVEDNNVSCAFTINVYLHSIFCPTMFLQVDIASTTFLTSSNYVPKDRGH